MECYLTGQDYEDGCILVRGSVFGLRLCSDVCCIRAMCILRDGGSSTTGDMVLDIRRR